MKKQVDRTVDFSVAGGGKIAAIALKILRNHEYAVRPMIFPFIGTTVILGMITGFADLNKRGFFRTLGGQIVHCLLHTCGSCFLALRLENRPA
jgi:hypothetical protein